MSMMSFHLLFPEEAKNETRTITPMNHAYWFAWAVPLLHQTGGNWVQFLVKRG